MPRGDARQLQMAYLEMQARWHTAVDDAVTKGKGIRGKLRLAMFQVQKKFGQDRCAAPVEGNGFEKNEGRSDRRTTS